MFLKSEWSNRLVQVSLFSAIVYYITAYSIVFEKATKYFPVKFKNTHHILLFHTFVFAVLMYVLTYFVFDPLVKVVEGAEGAACPNPKMDLRFMGPQVCMRVQNEASRNDVDVTC